MRRKAYSGTTSSGLGRKSIVLCPKKISLTAATVKPFMVQSTTVGGTGDVTVDVDDVADATDATDFTGGLM
jgi:hypothetical protein